MRQQPTTEPQLPRAPRRAEDRTRERDKTCEARQRLDRQGGDPENPMIVRGID